MAVTIPLFPLNAVLFPGGVLPLRIFEPRYLDMISESLRNDTPIGVVLIKDGQETGEAAQTHHVGTLSHISYWNRRPDGLLGITLRGTRRFHINSLAVQPNQLILAEVDTLPELEPVNNNHQYQFMTDLLRKILSQLSPPYTTMPMRYDDLEWVSARLCELMPMPLDFKQSLLQNDDVFARIEQLHRTLKTAESA